MAEPEVLYWYDPMRPEVHFDQPGPSPFMDMALVPKYASGGTDAAPSIEVSGAMIQALGIRTAPVETGTFWKRVDTVGTLEIDPHRIRVIESRAQGWVEQQTVHAVGEAVREGQVLASVYAPTLLAAQQEWLQAQRQGDETVADAARERLRLLGATTAQLARIERSGKAERSIELLAPSDGVVIALDVHEGQQIGPGQPLMRIADLSEVWMMAQVPEAQSEWITAERPVEAQFAALPGESFEGQVDYIYPSLNPATRTLPVRLRFDNADGRLRPGMFAAVTLYGGPRRDVLMIPTEALIRTGSRSTVIVADDDTHFRPAAVTVGNERLDRAEIRAGLDAGMRVVISGQFLIDSEANLRGAFARMPMDGAQP